MSTSARAILAAPTLHAQIQPAASSVLVSRIIQAIPTADALVSGPPFFLYNCTTCLFFLLLLLLLLLALTQFCLNWPRTVNRLTGSF